MNIAFGHVKNNEVRIDHLKNTQHIKNLKRYNQRLKILLSIGGWSEGGFSEALSTEDSCRTFAKTSDQALKSLEIHGIDVDWEYPLLGIQIGFDNLRRYVKSI